MSESRTTSPSSFSLIRSTPCVLGCWGPMLSYIHSLPSSRASTPSGRVWVKVSATDGVGLQPFELLVREDHGFAERDVVLAQWKALPGVRHQDPAQVGMAVELDPEQVPGLALEPVGGPPDGHQARHMRIGRG